MSFRLLGDIWLASEMILLPLVIVAYWHVRKHHLHLHPGGLMEAIANAVAIMLAGRLAFVAIVAMSWIGPLVSAAIETARGLRVLPLLFAALPIMGWRGRRGLLWAVSAGMGATFLAALWLWVT